MTARSTAEVAGAVATGAVAILAMLVIAFGFLAPEVMLETIGVAGFGVAILAMVGCAIVANLYDLRGILVDALG